MTQADFAERLSLRYQNQKLVAATGVAPSARCLPDASDIRPISPQLRLGGLNELHDFPPDRFTWSVALKPQTDIQIDGAEGATPGSSA